MKILVCVKQVPESEVPITVHNSSKPLAFGRNTVHRMNGCDECAAEEALRIKELFPKTTVDIISIGPESAEAVIRRAIGMGADQGIHVVTAIENYYDPLITAHLIAFIAKKNKYDLILAGAMSEDLMQGQVGPMVAELIGFPCATAVISKNFLEDHKTIQVEREVEGGIREIVQLILPALITIQTGINQPRYPTLSHRLRANKMELETVSAGSLDTPHLKQHPVWFGYPEKSRDAVFLDGSLEEKAKELLKILTNRSLIG